jgi:hypothetical protein
LTLDGREMSLGGFQRGCIVGRCICLGIHFLCVL